MRRVAIWILLICFASNVRSQDSVTVKSPTVINVALASLIPAGAIAAAVYQNYADFWKDDHRVPFYFSNDPPYSMQQDKLGHAYFSSVTSDLIRSGYQAADVPPLTSAWLGMGFSFLNELLVEIEDGHHANQEYFGFSPGDAVADFLGASIPLAKTYWPSLQALDYKFSVWPSDALKQGAYNQLLDDNESQFFWISADVHKLFAYEVWPQWLNVAIGHGAENLKSTLYLPNHAGLSPKGQWYIAPDINLRGLPIHGTVWDVAAEVLSHFRIPFVAIEVAPRFKVWIR